MQWLSEQALLLEIVLVFFYSVQPPSVDDFTTVLTLFRVWRLLSHHTHFSLRSRSMGSFS